MKSQRIGTLLGWLDFFKGRGEPYIWVYILPSILLGLLSQQGLFFKMKMTTTTEKDESNLLKLQAHPPIFHPQVLKVQHVRLLVKNI